METLNTVEQAVEQAIQTVGKNIVLGMPLGLGKPNQLANAFYQRALHDPSIQLRIITALSLEKPRPKTEIEAQFLVPFVERIFGNYVELDYMKAIRANNLPKNITVSEFYFKAGAMKKAPVAQQNYISTNYTFAARDIMLNGINVLGQMVATKNIDGTDFLSLSCNADTTPDMMPLIKEAREQGKKIITIAQIHHELPFMYNQAMVKPDYFDLVIDNAEYQTTLFAPPNMSVPPVDFVAGLYASALIKDAGTLQIGIGSLGDAIVYASKLRHENNDTYKEMLSYCTIDEALIQAEGGTKPFSTGIYGSSEMFVNGFMHLIEAGIVKRQVYDDVHLQSLLNDKDICEVVSKDMLRTLVNKGILPSSLQEAELAWLKRWGIFHEGVTWRNDKLVVDNKHLNSELKDTDSFTQICNYCLGDKLKGGIHMHGGFFLGPKSFYDSLRGLTRQQAEKICMSSVGHINQLDFDHRLLSLQRKHARFINTAMMVTLSGAAVSDGLEDGTVVSGVGGQYNFVAMAHALKDARSILCIRSTRGEGKNLKSNIVASYGHTTIPRHLRDIVITEYGIADLRGKTDQDVGIALIKIADSRFQEGLIRSLIEHGKLSRDYQLPEQYRQNLPSKIDDLVSHFRQEGFFPAFPLGTDFTDQEIALGKSLKDIKALSANRREMFKAVLRSFIHKVDEEQARPFLERLNLQEPHTAKETILQHLLLLELEENGYLKPM